MTGNAAIDDQQKRLLEEELARLQKNKERRHVREKQKSLQHGTTSVPATPDSPAANTETPAKSGAKWQAGATQRKCANCGQTGHIKTNKKLCPLYKDGKLPEFDNAAFGGSAQPNGQPNGTQSQTQQAIAAPAT